MSDINLQPVVGHMHVRGKLGFGMQAGLMAHVYEVCFTSAYLSRKCYGIIDRLMRTMGIVSQTVDNKRVYTLQCSVAFGWCREHIGDEPQSPDAVAKDGQCAMHDLYGSNLCITDIERLVGLYAMEV